MKRLFLALALLVAIPVYGQEEVSFSFMGTAIAQNIQCPTRPSTDSSNACASTQFVKNVLSGGSTFIRITGSDAASTPTLNSQAFLEILNTNVGAAGRSSQIRFGAVSGDPYAMISSQIASGPSPYVGNLAFALRLATPGALQNILFLNYDQGGLYSNITGSTTTNPIGTGFHNFSGYNPQGGQVFVGYTKSLPESGGSPGGPYTAYLVAMNDKVGYAGEANALYAEFRISNTSFGSAIQTATRNFSGANAGVPTPVDLFAGAGARAFGLQITESSSLAGTRWISGAAIVMDGQAAATDKFWKGIVFGANLLSAVSGNLEAINFAQDYQIVWYDAAGTSQNRLQGDGTKLLSSAAFNITSNSATAFAVGRLGATTPAFQVDASTGTSITGVKVKSAASGGGVDISAIGETNVAVTVNAAGSGTVSLNPTGTGNITTPRVTTITNATAATSTTTGALQVTGGIGVQDKVYATHGGGVSNGAFNASASINNLYNGIYAQNTSTGTGAAAVGFFVNNVNCAMLLGAAGSNYAGIAILQGTAFFDANVNCTALTFNTENAAVPIVFSTANTQRLKIMGSSNHLAPNGTAPALTSCGTTPAISGSDVGGEVTMGTGAPTGCVITFNVAYAAAPYCVVTWQTNIASMQYTVSTTAITLVQTGTSSNKVNYHCLAQSGG